METVNSYPIPQLKTETTIDFINSTSLERLENGIKKLEGVGDILALIQGIAIVKIESEALYNEAGFQCLNDYRKLQTQRYNMPKQTLSDRRRIGEGWLAFGEELKNFALDGHISKIRYLNKALERHKDKKKVVQAFKTKTAREFQEYALGPKLLETNFPDVDIEIKDDEILLDGEALLTLDEELTEEEKNFISSILLTAYKVRKGGYLVHISGVYDMGEAKAVDNFIKKRRSSL